MLSRLVVIRRAAIILTPVLLTVAFAGGTRAVPLLEGRAGVDEGKPADGQVLRVHPSNPRCFLYQGRPVKLLTSGEHYGAVINRDFNYDVYLDELHRNGLNLTRTFTFYREKPSNIPEPGNQNTLAPRPEAAVMPWLRMAAHGKAADGLDKFDLDRWDPAYFARWKDFLGKCAEHGVICEVVLFSRPYQRDRYDLLPLSSASNINGVGRGDPSVWNFLTLRDSGMTAAQEQFVRKIVTELNPFDNLYYEICNEPKGSPDVADAMENEIIAWHLHMARVIRQTEARLPKRHLIAANCHQRIVLRESDGGQRMWHKDQHYLDRPEIDILNYHYTSSKTDVKGFGFRHLPNEGGQAGAIWHFLRQRDQFAKPIVFDETFTGIVRKQPERYPINRAEAWETILSGGAGYENLDWSFTPADATGSGQSPITDGRRLDGRPLRRWLTILRRLLDKYDLAALVPAIGLLPERVPGYGYAASTDGKGRYIVYLADEKLYRSQPCQARPLDVQLTLPAGRYALQTLDPKTGPTTTLPEIESQATVRLVIPAFQEDTAVLIGTPAAPVP